MTLFSDIFSGHAVPALMETMGTAEVLYREPEEDDVPLTAIVGHMEVAEVEGANGGRRRRAERTFLISTDPDSDYGGVAEPRLSASLIYDEQEWAVERIENQSESMARLVCVRKGAIELSRKGYRGT